MPFEIIRNDIVQVRADAIVNTANPRPVIGAGTDAGIHAAAGPELLKARKAIGPMAVGEAAVTPGFNLPAKYVIHTVGPQWQGGGAGEEQLLERCYRSCLELAGKKGCRSIAFPLISAGTYGFPKDRALQCALRAISGFLMEQELMVWLVVFNREAFRLSEQLFRGVKSYIDEHYVERTLRAEGWRANFPRERGILLERRAVMSEPECCSAPMAVPMCLEELVRQTDAGFSETLLKLIDQTGRKDSEIYTRANVSRQHFSKIRNNPDYRPTKPTALAFAIALELTLEQTTDLIGRAGYALTNSSKFDVIIRYFIEQGNYNLFDINAALFEFDQSLLGA